MKDSGKSVSVYYINITNQLMVNILSGPNIFGAWGYRFQWYRIFPQRYDMFKEESQKKESFQEAANSWRKEMKGTKWGNKPGKRANKIWGKQSAATPEKDHTGLYKFYVLISNVKLNGSR